MTPMERTLKVLKEQDFLVQIVETWNAHAGTRRDLYGFLDILAIHPKHGTLGVQVCGTDFTEHVKKMTGPRKEALILFLLGNNRVVLIGWRKLKKTGWTPRTKEFFLRDLGIDEKTETALRSMEDPECPEWIKPKENSPYD